MQPSTRPISRPVIQIASITAIAGLAVLGVTIGAAAAPAVRHHHQPGSQGFVVTPVLNGADLTHTFTPSGSSTPMTETLSNPDDITQLHGLLFTAFQNGVGPQGQASASGNLDSTIVEYTRSGKVLNQWDIQGKCDGLTADPLTGLVIATVNEDLNSSIYTIRPGYGGHGHGPGYGKHGGPGRSKHSGTVLQYQYSSNPLPSNGGTDAISVYHGMVLVSASAPGTATGSAAPPSTYPAVYIVTFDQESLTADVSPLFNDDSPALALNGSSANSTINLALTDPDSNEVVPWYAQQFAGDFMETSQGDQQQIFVTHPGQTDQRLRVLNLSASVDDTAWPAGHGELFAADTSGDAVDMVTGPFVAGAPYVAVTPCDENSAPSTCPAPPAYPPNYLGVLDPSTGAIAAVPATGATLEPQGMLWYPGNHGDGRWGR